MLICKRSRKLIKKTYSPVARLFGPSIFEAPKLQVLFMGVDEMMHPGNLPRTYTFTHSDVTCKLTLAISQTINNSQLQGWYNKFYRDEVVAEWRKVKDEMSLHVHCHISGGHFLLDLFARLRFFIFTKELPLYVQPRNTLIAFKEKSQINGKPMNTLITFHLDYIHLHIRVLKAFEHGDGSLLSNYPELQEALVWVYFHSNIPEFNRVECWGPLKEASKYSAKPTSIKSIDEMPHVCGNKCSCCFPSPKIHWSKDLASVMK
ncbi:hypothetical protein OSB04_011308 [Centaurea solstitialis]|uniref:Staygreen protein domain-containing protein n=1 Tax=Centaurea solstitialis TaxID=347529 RepID=A0AA38T970_9ASTR|nr:hypothetical protein OSB04_011308 [Centaurea solstitialis]